MNLPVTRFAWSAIVAAVTILAVTSGAQDIQPYQAEEVRPYYAEPVRPGNGSQSVGLATNAPGVRWAVAGLECNAARCESVFDREANAPVILVSGTSRSHADNRAVYLVILAENRQAVRKERIIIGSDRSFRATIPIAGLAPGAYRFGVVAAEQSATVIAAGSFSVTTPAPVASGARQDPAAAPGRSAVPPPATPADPRAAALFFRTFGLAIPGVVYTTDNYATNTRNTTIASGAVTKSAVRVNADGTYVWNSAWDGKVIRGRWKRDGGELVLLSGQSGHDWRMARLPQPQGKAVIVLYDSSTQYHGTPLD